MGIQNLNMEILYRRDNFIRTNDAIYEVFADILRDQLSNQIAPEDLKQRLNEKSGKKIKRMNITDEQDRIIQKATRIRSYQEMDITLLCTLLRNVCNTKTPSKGWNIAPDASDTSFGADIERIRLMRNKFFHAPVAELPDDEFNEMWEEMEDICQRADTRIPGNFYSVKLSNLKIASLDKFSEEKLNVLEEKGIKDPLEIAIERKGNTVQKWEENEACFFQTRASKAVQCCLQNSPVVTVVGRSGTGKTFTCQQIANLYKRRGWIPLPVSTFEEFLTLVNPRSRHRQMYILDDPLGKERRDEVALDNFRKSARSLQGYLEYSQNIKLMITSRYPVEHGFMSFNNIVIDDAALGLSDDEKRGILSKYESSWGLDENDRKEILRIDDYFPLLCSMFENGAYRKHGILFFKNPRHILEKEIRFMHEEQYCALLLLAVNNGCLTEDFFTSDQEQDKSLFANICEISCLRKDTSRISVMKQLNLLLGNLLSLEENNFKFRHDYILETVTLMFGREFPKEMLKLCPIEFICHNVAWKETHSERNSTSFLLIDDHMIENLIERIFSEFRKGTCLPIYFSNLLNNEKLIAAICEYIQVLNSSDFQSIFLTIHKNFSSWAENITSVFNFFNDIISKVEFGTIFSSEMFTELVLKQGICTRDENDVRHIIEDIRHFFYEKKRTLLESLRNYIESLEDYDITCLDLLTFFLYDGDVTKKNKQAVKSCLKPYLQCLFCDFGSEFKKYCNSLVNHNVFKDDTKVDLDECVRIASLILEMHPSELLILDMKYVDLFEGRESLKKELTIFAPRTTISSCFAFTGNKQIFDCILKRIHDEKLLHSCCKERKLFISSCAVGSLRFMKSCLREFDPKLLDEKWHYHYNYLTLLHCSAVFQNPEEMAFLLENGVDVDECDKLGNSALHLAIESCISDEKGVVKANGKCEEMVQLLLGHKADVNLKNVHRRTPVHLAAQASNTRVLRLLLQQDCKEDEKDCNGWSPLHYACKIGLVPNIDCLLKCGKKVSLLNDKTNSGETPLYVASQYGRAAAVKKLLDYHADVNTCDANERTPLVVAVLSGQEAVVNQLAKHKADINLKDSSGATPLLYASNLGYLGIAKTLIKNNANVNACSTDGWNPLLVASINNNESIVKLLLENMADANICGRSGDTSLMHASCRGFSKIAEILLQNRADVNAVNNNKHTALSLAANNGHLKIVQQLLKFLRESYLVHLVNEQHALSLFQAAANGHISVVEELITYKANVDQSTETGDTPLMISSYNQHYEVVELLLRKGANVNLVQRECVTALHFAAKNENEEIVKLLLRKKADISICDILGNSPLHLATQNGRLNTIKRLIEHGADPNWRNKDGRSILHIAAIYGHENIVSFVLSQQWYSDTEDNLGFTAVSLAASCGNKNIVKKLLRDVDNIDKQDRAKETLLMSATKSEQFEVVKWLLNEGANVDMQECNGNTSLILAARCGNEQITEELLKFGADINKKNYIGDSALMEASKFGHKEIVELLCENDATVNTINDNTAHSELFQAASNSHTSVAEELISHRANIDQSTNMEDTSSTISSYIHKQYHEHVHLLIRKDAISMTALYFAARNGNEEIVKFLLNVKSDLSMCDLFGDSPLHIATLYGRLNLIECLMEHGAAINANNNFGHSALFLAVVNGHVTVIKFLLDHGANIDNCDIDGFSPLMVACDLHRSDVVKLLLDHSADVNLQDRKGRTALHIAVHHNFQELVELLLKKNPNQNIYADNGFCAFHMAVSLGHLDAMTLFLKYGLDTQVSTENGDNALHIAAMNGRESIVLHLLENDFPLNVLNKNKESALFLAASHGETEIVKLLCDYMWFTLIRQTILDKRLICKGANVDKQWRDGYPPVVIVFKTGQTDMVEFFLHHGAT